VDKHYFSILSELDKCFRDQCDFILDGEIIVYNTLLGKPSNFGLNKVVAH